MRARKTLTAAGMTAALLGTLIAGAGTANAAGPSYRGCGDGSGFYGQVRFWYAYDGSKVAYVGKVQYKIDKNGGSDRKQANIVWLDDGLPGGYGGTDFGIQDNQWHDLPTASDYYRPKKDAVRVWFNFDRFGPDPDCEARWTM